MNDVARECEGETQFENTLWYCVRKGGVAKHSGWLTGIRLSDALSRVNATDGDIVEANALRQSSPVDPSELRAKFPNRQRGLVGIEFRYRDSMARFAPSFMIASNLSFDRARQRFLEKVRASHCEFARTGKVYALNGPQYLLNTANEQLVELLRGSTRVAYKPLGDITHVESLIDGIRQWMLQNLTHTSELPYKYWPSRGEWSPADNAIRRFLASLSLARLAEYRASPKLRLAARDNLRHNLSRYFRAIGDGRGAIVETTGAKLGAAAVAGLAILENHYRSEFIEELHMLARGIEYLVDRKNGFRTFLFPTERDGDNWNFYSGEALLFWTEALRREMEFAPTLDQCIATFLTCRRRHLRNPNPAFVPWHTQVCASMHALTKNREFANFAFEMSDWLLPMQQWDEVYDDMRGRFYSPRHPEWGPPHAASTGAYCEGLADALALAKCFGYSTRASRYSIALARGFRSLRQLQFRNSIDAFYVSRRDRVIGALRTEVYDNSIRLDSAAHALLAALKVLCPTQRHLRS